MALRRVLNDARSLEDYLMYECREIAVDVYIRRCEPISTFKRLDREFVEARS